MTRFNVYRVRHSLAIKSSSKNKATFYEKCLEYGKNKKLLVCLYFIIIGLGLLGSAFWVVPLVANKFFDDEKGSLAADSSIPVQKKSKTLKERFESDFGKVFSIDDEHDISFTPSESKITSTIKVNNRVNFDWNSRAIFLSFYIPTSPYSEEFCFFVIQQKDDLISYAKKHIGAEYISLGEEKMDLTYMEFSARVFIYHEDSLSEETMENMISMFEKKGIYLHFRGPEYEIAQNLYEAT